MAKVLCSISGVEFNCEFLPIPLNSREAFHPIFNLDTKRLYSLFCRWSEGRLPETESYLTFLALLNSTDKIEFRVPVSRTAQTVSIVAQNMESLARIVLKIDVITHPKFIIPKFVISPETKTLTNVSHWIESWHSCYADFLNGNKAAEFHDQLVRREQALERLIKDQSKNRINYVRMLADWAADAGNFPKGMVASISICDYWKSIITRCLRDDAIFSIPRKDLEELIEHCEDNIDHGSIYSHALMDVLRTGLHKQKNFLGLGDIDISQSTYRILKTDDSVESANVMAMIDSAPANLPVRSNYPTALAYLKAKVRFDMAIRYGRNAEDTIAEKIETITNPLEGFK